MGHLMEGDLRAWVTSQRITDLFVFAHGWNSGDTPAEAMFDAFFGAMEVIPSRHDAVIGTVGVHWPSTWWPDGVSPSMQSLVERQPRSHAELRKFHCELNPLLPQALVIDDYREALEALSPPGDDGGAAGFDPFARLWSGAKAGLRVASYFQMKARAGVVGERGLGPLLAGVPARVHLLGHSFGARLVSFALRSVPAGQVKSLFLLQGAFSHFAFASRLPFDRERQGELAGLDRNVDGPLLTTHSLHDMAVTTAYPLASIAGRQDASMASDRLYRWGAMGHDGAQCVDAEAVPLEAVRSRLKPRAGKWVNLDGNRLIVHGGPPSGAHSDFVHPETAWAAVAATGLLASQ